MITTDDVKNYCRVDYTDDDSLIESMISVSYDYLRGAIDDFDTIYADTEQPAFARQADMFAKFYAASLYDNREQFSGGPVKDVPYMCRSLLTQLQMTVKTEDTTTTTD